VVENFLDKMFVHFGLLQSISDESKTIGSHQNFVLFLNMGLEMLCLFLLKSSEELFERFEKLLPMVNLQVFVYAINLFSNRLKIVEDGRFIEWTLLYKM
jgi:hypothetical protein